MAGPMAAAPPMSAMNLRRCRRASPKPRAWQPTGSRRFSLLRRRTGSRRRLLVRAIVLGWDACPRQGGRRSFVSKNDRQAVFAAADDDHLRIRRLGKLERRLNAAPTQVRVRNALTNDLLKIAYAFALDPLALRLSFFPLDAEFIFLRYVVLLGLAVDGGHYRRRQFDAGHKYIVEDDGIPHRDAIRLLLAFVLHHLLGQPGLRKVADLVLNFLACRRVHLLGSVLSHDLARQTADSRLHQYLLVVRADRLVQHRHCIALQPKPDDDRCIQADTVAGDRVVGLGKGLQPQVI